ncbi:GNAT family N-acetyltransferase [Arthrobacter cheniae]|uniref:GNAT family N-acetyltransferase n=1 Tax=Arthrobacter cheniae TaxID=1258888 RepID=A0A3A5M4W9_9MICC|nr:GNAT family N-acetyltransferase [Arthrobacter cheniae]
MPYVIRSATVDDAEAYARTHVAGLHETYEHIMPPEYHAYYDAQLPAIIERRRAAFEEASRTPDSARSWLAFDDGEPVAIATSGPGRDDDRPDFELHHIYTLRSTHGTGLGQRLLDIAIGTRAAYLWILNGNPRAERFYVRNGFEPDGTSMLCGTTWHHRPMFRMHRPDRGPAGTAPARG